MNILIYIYFIFWAFLPIYLNHLIRGCRHFVRCLVFLLIFSSGPCKHCRVWETAATHIHSVLTFTSINGSVWALISLIFSELCFNFCFCFRSSAVTESRFDQSTYFLKIFLKTKGPPTTVAKLSFWLNLALWESFGSHSQESQGCFTNWGKDTVAFCFEFFVPKVTAFEKVLKLNMPCFLIFLRISLIYSLLRKFG